MRWLKRDMRKVGIALAALLFLFLLMVWVPLSASAYEGTSGLAAPGTVQATPTLDLTVTALAKEQLTLQVKQLQNQLENQNNWFANNSTALIAAVATVIVALFGIYQWTINRRDERQKERDAQDKDLRAQAEERFKTAVAALGDENEATQVGGAILLRSFLNPNDKEIYGRYYTQMFDLAVAYLCLPTTSRPSEVPDGTPPSLEDANTPPPRTPRRQALIVVFKEAFPLARDRLKEQDPKTDFHREYLDATGIQLYNAYLSGADLKQAWMPKASLRRTNLSGADLSGANLREACLTDADLRESDLSGSDLSIARLIRANLWGADLSGVDLRGAYLQDAILNEAKLREANLEHAYLKQANLSMADLSRAILNAAKLSGAHLGESILTEASLRWADLSKADLGGANLSRADLSKANIEDALSLQGTDLRGVIGLDDTHLKACENKGAIIDQIPKASAPQSTVSPPSQSNEAQR